MDSQPPRHRTFARVRRLVVKIGTGVLTAPGGGLDAGCIDGLCSQFCRLADRGIEVIVVSSGAIGAGINTLGLKRRPTLLPELQAAAAVGQNRLIAAYEASLARLGRHAGQVLLTREDLEDRRRFVNAGNTIRELARMGAIPVINENDTVSVDEIKFGGNDVLAALVLHVLKADAAIFLSTVDGLYDAAGAVIDVVDCVTSDTMGLDTGRKSALGIGGMQTKLQSIQEITNAGDPVVIANGKTPDILLRVMDGEKIGTLFLAAETRMCGRKRWLLFSVKPRGTITIDEGAVRALVERNKSLLASGICEVKGTFGQGDVVAVAGPGGTVVAKGLTHYSSDELAIIKGAKTSEIVPRLGYKYYDEVIHRDNLVTIE